MAQLSIAGRLQEAPQLKTLIRGQDTAVCGLRGLHQARGAGLSILLLGGEGLQAGSKGEQAGY